LKNLFNKMYWKQEDIQLNILNKKDKNISTIKKQHTTKSDSNVTTNSNSNDWDLSNDTHSNNTSLNLNINNNSSKLNSSSNLNSNSNLIISDWNISINNKQTNIPDSIIKKLNKAFVKISDNKKEETYNKVIKKINLLVKSNNNSLVKNNINLLLWIKKYLLNEIMENRLIKTIWL
jgi:hypothetical protein